MRAKRDGHDAEVQQRGKAAVRFESLAFDFQWLAADAARPTDQDLTSAQKAGTRIGPRCRTGNGPIRLKCRALQRFLRRSGGLRLTAVGRQRHLAGHRQRADHPARARRLAVRRRIHAPAMLTATASSAGGSDVDHRCRGEPVLLDDRCLGPCGLICPMCQAPMACSHPGSRTAN